jgi:flavin reductase (DIM6/NTAB) family NADH-FMN oxidoreductase RutF
MRTTVSGVAVLSRDRDGAAPTEPGADGVSGDVFRRAMARCAAGVVVITTADGPSGLTASSFTSVSADPPLVSFCVDRSASTSARLCDAETFTVNVLTEAQHDIASRFASHGVDRFAAPTRWHPAPDGTPLLDAAAAYLHCRRHSVIPLGDHWLVVGLLVGVGDGDGDGAIAPPLVYHHGRYGRIVPIG